MDSAVQRAPHAVLVILGEYLDGSPRENTVYCYSAGEVAEIVSQYREWGQAAYQLY